MFIRKSTSSRHIRVILLAAQYSFASFDVLNLHGLEGWPRNLGSGPRTSRASRGTRRGAITLLRVAKHRRGGPEKVLVRGSSLRETPEQLNGFQLLVRRICCSNMYQYITALLITMVSLNVCFRLRCLNLNLYLLDLASKCLTGYLVMFTQTVAANATAAQLSDSLVC